MLVELSVMPVDGKGELSQHVAEVLKIVDDSGLPYKFTPTGTCIEGSWDKVMALVRECHEKVRGTSDHVVTVIKIEDEAGATNKLVTNIRSVEDRIGRQLAA